MAFPLPPAATVSIKPSSLAFAMLSRTSPLSSDVGSPYTEGSDPFDSTEALHQHDFLDERNFVLVVGGLGFIGSHTTLELLKDGFNVVIIDNLANSFRRTFDQLKSLRDHYCVGQSWIPSVEFYEADYRDRRTMEAILRRYAKTSGGRVESRILGVIHFAAHKAVEESIQQPLEYYANNVSGMVDFCSILRDFGIKTFVFSSSATVYGELAAKVGRISEHYCTHEPAEIIESNGQRREIPAGCSGLANPYGRTKWMCEAILNDLAASDPEWAIFALRYFNPIGCDSSGMLGEEPRKTPTNLMPMLVKVMNGEAPDFNVYGTDWDTADGSAIRDFIHVTDLARGHIAALAASLTRRGFHAFNLGTGTGYSVLEVVAAMEKAWKKHIPLQLMGRRAGDVASCVAEPLKAWIELGWKTQKTLHDCCKDSCHFLKQKALR